MFGLSFLSSAATLALDFLKTRAGIAVIALAIGGFLGFRMADKAAELERANAVIAALRADVAIAQKAEAVAKDQAAGLKAIATSNQEKVNVIRSQTAKRVKERRSCAATDADIGSLLDIR